MPYGQLIEISALRLLTASVFVGEMVGDVEVIVLVMGVVARRDYIPQEVVGAPVLINDSLIEKGYVFLAGRIPLLQEVHYGKFETHIVLVAIDDEGIVGGASFVLRRIGAILLVIPDETVCHKGVHHRAMEFWRISRNEPRQFSEQRILYHMQTAAVQHILILPGIHHRRRIVILVIDPEILPIHRDVQFAIVIVEEIFHS